MLQMIESRCFAHSKLTKITIPPNVTTIEQGAFYMSTLKKISFQEGSKLEKIGPECFRSSDIEEFQAP